MQETLVVKVLLTLVAVVAWFASQKALGRRGLNRNSKIQDYFHDWTSGINQRIYERQWLSRSLLISSSVVIDALGFFVIAVGLFSNSYQALFGLILLFTLRQLNQAMTALPVPENMIWKDPGFPSVFVTYGVASDLFFSGHTALAVYGSLVIVQLYPFLWPLAIVLVLFEVLVVLLLRAHWTMDVFAGAVTAFWIFDLSTKLAPTIDAWILRLGMH